MEGLALELGGGDQAMRDWAGRESPFDLGGEIAARAPRPILLRVGQIILVGRSQQRPRDLRAPWRVIIAGNCPDPAGRQPVAAAVERVGVSEGHRIETVELASAGEGDSRCSDFDLRSGAPGRAQSPGEVAVAVAVAEA